MIKPDTRPSVDVCVCTFRRPELADTLRSLTQMKSLANYRTNILVSDNDVTPSARPLVSRLVKETGTPICYLHSPSQNISVARNACLEASTADFLAFVDDDETVTEEWLHNLLETAEGTGADVVLGPVEAIYDDEAPSWMRRGDFHSTLPVWVDGQIKTGYTCNVLFRRDAEAVKGKRFNLSRGRTGGEDTEFFDLVYGSGGRIAYSEKALVKEKVPTPRTSFDWLLKRRFRNGQTHGHLSAGKLGLPGLGMMVVKTLSKIGFCLGATLLCLFSNVSRNRAFLRGAMHVGVLTGLLGLGELRLYETPTAKKEREGAA